MPAPTDTVQILLRAARDAELAASGGGLAFLRTGRQLIASAEVNAGRIITSVSGGGKSYSFTGRKLEDAAADLNEAEKCWAYYSLDQLSRLLDVPSLRRTSIAFSGAN